MKKLLALLFVVIFASLSLVSCFFPNADKAEKLLEDEDYEVEDVDSDDIEYVLDMIDVKLPDCDEIITAWDEDDNQIIIFYCESSADAKDLEADFNDVLEDEDLEDEVEDIFYTTPEVYRSGKAVCVGSKKAIKILK